MLKFVAGAMAVMLLAPTARAGGASPDDEAAAMRDFFTGTLEIANPAGDWSAKRWFSPDHTYRETGSDGQVRGGWEIENGKICTMRENPTVDAEHAARYCNLGVGKHAGEQWKDADPVTGNAVFFTLKAGR